MPVFKTGEREWILRIDAPAIQAVRDRVGVDLADVTGETFAKLNSDPVLLVNALWVLVEDQAAKVSITDEQFGRSLVGDPIEQAAEALLNAILDFFPSGKRPMLMAMAQRQKRMQTKAMELILTHANDEERENEILGKIRGLLIQSNAATN